MRHLNSRYFIYLLLILVILIKISFLLDTPYQIRYSPFDDNLYIKYANQLLENGGIPSFESNPLLKKPTFPFVLAIIAKFEVDYKILIEILLIVSGLFFIYAINLYIKNNLVSLITFIIILYNPIIFSNNWNYIMREPLSSILDLFTVSLLLLLKNSNTYIRLIYVIFLIIIFIINLNLREEDAIRWIFLLLSFLVYLKYSTSNLKIKIFQITSILIIITLINYLINFNYRNFVYSKTNVNISNQLTDGEFPKLMSNLRALSDNKIRLAPITYQNLQDLSILIPELRNIFNLISPPNYQSLSCKNLGICKEIAYPYLSFYILSATAENGITKYSDAENFYKKINLKLKEICEIKKCKKENDKFIKDFEFRFLLDFYKETYKLIKEIIYPKFISFSQNESNTNSSNLIKIYKNVLGETNFKEYNYSNYNLLVKPIYSVLIIISVVLIIAIPIYFRNTEISFLYYIFIIYIIYSIIRIICLGFIAVYMGGYESRIIYSQYLLLAAFSPALFYSILIYEKKI